MNNISKWIRRNVTACHNIHDSVRTWTNSSSVFAIRRLWARMRTPTRTPSTRRRRNRSRRRKISSAASVTPRTNLSSTPWTPCARRASHPAKIQSAERLLKALASIRALQVEVTSGAKIAKSGPDKVPNVGPSIGAQIDYFLGMASLSVRAFYEKGQLPPSERSTASGSKSSRPRTVTT